MVADKYIAVWVSHSSISDFLHCPRSYFLKNVFREEESGRKITLMNPALALGQCIHTLLEKLSFLPTDKRFTEPLMDRFEKEWQTISGKKGGFADERQEDSFFQRGSQMITRIVQHPGPLKELAVKIQDDLPHYWLSEEENIILCGKIDWLEYLSLTDSVHIIDFKTGKSSEDENSLQLPIYHLLVHNCQERKVSKASYWYLDRSDVLSSQKLPDLEKSEKKILTIARKIKLSRQMERFSCPNGSAGCKYCLPFEKIIHGEAEMVGLNDYNVNVYIIPKKPYDEMAGSEIL